MIICDLTMFPRSLFTAGTLTGFDASGHVAEETKHAKWVIVSIDRPCYFFILIVLSPNKQCRSRSRYHHEHDRHQHARFITTVVFLFCILDLDTSVSLDAPQPFVQ